MSIDGFDPKLSLVIPCFNEADNTELLVAKIAQLRALDIPQFEVIFVDGGSSDGTPDRLKASITENEIDYCTSVYIMSKKRGYGYDIMYGLHQAKADILAWTHADMQTDIQDIFTAYNSFIELGGLNKKIFIKGKRLKRPIVDALFTYGMQLFTLATIRINLSDINAQPKLFSRTFFESQLLKNAPNDFSLDLFALYHAKTQNYQIKTIPVYFRKRQFGEAKGGGGGFVLKLSLVRRTIKYILELKSYRL